MALLFLDSSALLKLYLKEVGSVWLQRFVVRQQIVISELALVEVVNTARRFYAEGKYSRDEALDLITQVVQNTTAYTIVPLGQQPQLNDLITLIFRLPLALRVRSLDSIHLGVAQIAFNSAKVLIPPPLFVFVTADQALLRAAKALGFGTENPEDYP